MFKANVDADLFRRCSLAQSNDKTRYYLNGVYIEPNPDGGVLMVATDGEIMLVFLDPLGTCEGSAIVALPSYMLKAAKPLKGGARRAILIDDSSGPTGAAVMTDGKGGELVAKNVLIDASFPTWRRVIPSPKEDAVCLGYFKTNKVCRLGEALAIDSKQQCLSIVGDAPRDPHIVRGPNQKGFGVIIGAQRDEPPSGIPFNY